MFPQKTVILTGISLRYSGEAWWVESSPSLWTTPLPYCPCQPSRHTLERELPNVLLTGTKSEKGATNPQKAQLPDQLFLLIQLDSLCKPGIYAGKPWSHEGPAQFVQKFHLQWRVDLVSEKHVWNKCIFLYESFNIRREIQLIAIDLYTWLSVTAYFIGRWKQKTRERKALLEDAGWGTRKCILQNMVWLQVDRLGSLLRRVLAVMTLANSLRSLSLSFSISERGITIVPISQAVRKVKSVSATEEMRALPAMLWVLNAWLQKEKHTRAWTVLNPCRQAPQRGPWVSAVNLLFTPLGLNL